MGLPPQDAFEGGVAVPDFRPVKTVNPAVGVWALLQEEVSARRAQRLRRCLKPIT
jgi:hypothetical protein